MRDHYIIHYVLHGKGVFEQDGDQYALGASEGFLITPYNTVTYRADTVEPWKYCWFAFRGSETDELLSRCGLSRQSPVFRYHLAEPLENHIPANYSASTASASCDFEALGNLYVFLALLMRNHETQNCVDSGQGNSLRQALAYIEANYFNELTVEALASTVGLSRSQLYRVFKSTLGTSPQNHILQYRLSKAKFLVCNTSLSVAEIALSCGFTDQSYFTRCFRTRFGSSPLIYRSSEEAKSLQR